MGMVRTVSDLMSRDVVTLFEEDNLARVHRDLNRFRFHHMPVVDDGKVVGILSQRDLLRAAFAGLDASPAARAREARVLEQTFVRDLMRTDVVTARPEEPVRSAARKMLDAGISALPVIDQDGLLVGIVTENDITRLAAEVL